MTELMRIPFPLTAERLEAIIDFACGDVDHGDVQVRVRNGQLVFELADPMPLTMTLTQDDAL
jgi:hypothetical protein